MKKSMRYFYSILLILGFSLPANAIESCKELEGFRFKYHSNDCNSNKKNWWVEFKPGGFFSWMHGDAFESGTYICKDGNIKAQSMMQKISGNYKEKKITWNGDEYSKDGSSRCGN